MHKNERTCQASATVAHGLLGLPCRRAQRVSCFVGMQLREGLLTFIFLRQVRAVAPECSQRRRGVDRLLGSGGQKRGGGGCKGA
eukprot:483193-Pelagomonas_calceolata.AAC.6